MLTNLAQQPADALLALIKLHHNDPRADKIDLGVGVYKTGQGDTPVFGAIKAAEKILVETQNSKAYLGPEGDMVFVEKLMPYIFGTANPTQDGRIEGMQTPGGTVRYRETTETVDDDTRAYRNLMPTPAGDGEYEAIKATYRRRS